MYGLPCGLTAYGGLQWAEHYRCGSLGLGMQVEDADPDGKDGQGLILRTREPQVRYEVVADGDKKVAADDYGLTEQYINLFKG